MTTAQNIHDRLSLPTAQTVDTVKAINAAIDESWPAFKLDEYHPMAAAFDADIFEYSLAEITLLDRALGPAEVWVAPETTAVEPVIEIHGWFARFDQSLGYWTLVVGNEIVDTYDGDTWYVRYQYKHPAISAIGDTLYLPADYARYYVQAWYAERRLMESQVDDRSQAAAAHLRFYQMARDALLRHLTPTLHSHAVGRDRLG